jgi:hypothetical protein
MSYLAVVGPGYLEHRNRVLATAGAYKPALSVRAG